MTDIHSGFQDVDRTAEAEEFFSFLDAASASESIQSCRRHMLKLCPPRSGSHILDVGCGIGHSALDLASRTGRTGSVVGIDKSESLIAEAKRRADESSASVTYQIGDARHLDFPDNRFDVCRAERVLMYVEAPERALDEMTRVLRPGGRLALFEFDYDCFIVDAADTALTRRIFRLVADSIPSPRIGRQLPRLLRERGVRDLAVIAHMIVTPLEMFRRVIGGTVSEAVERGELEAAQVGRWWRELDHSDRDGQFFSGCFGFIVSGHMAAE